MICECKRPVLVIEGAGDSEAIPLMMRRVFDLHNIYDVHSAPRPKTGASVPRFSREGELERWVQYALKDDGDSVIIAIDCEDDDELSVRRNMYERLSKLNRCEDKKIGLILFVREYETMFLHCLSQIALSYPFYGWNKEFLTVEKPELYRDAKGLISRCMSRDYAYKPTRDQARFSECLDLGILRGRSASFARFEDILLRMAQGTESIVV